MSKQLTDDQIAFFRKNGYLLLHDVLDPDLMARARDSVWEVAPPELKRDDPESWVGAFADNRWQWKYRDRGHEDWMIDLLARSPAVRGAAADLLGPDLEEAERVRGVYCIFPEGDAPEWPTRCHVDQHPFHLGAVAYVDDVPKGGGGFMVWPGSHKLFYPVFETAYTFNPRGEESMEIIRQVNAQEPVDTGSPKGSVVLWHHRLGHSAGHNRSKTIRMAVLYDFKRTDLAEVQDEPPPEDMWRDWPGVRT